jgi:hypothetical protein
MFAMEILAMSYRNVLRSLPVSGLTLAAVLIAGRSAQAAVISDTESVGQGGVVIFNNVENTASQTPNTFTAQFAGFNPALGTLTSTTFTLNLGYTASITAVGGGGQITFGGNYYFNAPAYLSNFTFDTTPTGPNFPLITTTGSLPTTTYPETQTVTLYGPAVAPDYSYTFTFASQTSFIGGGPSNGFANLTFNSGTVTAAYTYTAVPEPASLAVVGIPAAMALLRRRRKQINVQI